MTQRYAKPMSARARTASMQATLTGWNGRAPLWLFGYGSLIWKPELDFDLRVPARLHGYHRKLCLRSVHYRGTAEQPGLVAGLDRGGSCNGVLLRIRPEVVQNQFPNLWKREMVLGSYSPRWVTAQRLDRSGTVRALVFVVRRDADNYCGGLVDDEVIAILRTARGKFGSSLEYLRQTVTALHALGLQDRHLERLMHRASIVPAAPAISS